MKKLYRKSAVHPTPSVVSEHLLSFLPAAILTLTVALSPSDREVLAYLISCSSASLSIGNRKGNRKSGGGGGSSRCGGDDHEACFSCSCFRCYTSYWAKWDSSPNRQLIHEVIDAFEESLSKESKREKNRRERRKGKSVKVSNIGLGMTDEPKKSSEMRPPANDAPRGEADGDAGEIGGGSLENDVDMEESAKGSVRRFVSFVGERIWSAWG